MHTPTESHTPSSSPVTQSTTPDQVRDTLESSAVAEFMKDVDTVQLLIGNRAEHLSSLRNGIDTPGREQEILDEFIRVVGIESITPETRYIAYERLCHLYEDALMNHVRRSELSSGEEFTLKENAYIFTAEYHNNLNTSILDDIEKRGLLTPFYRTLLRGVFSVGVAFNRFHRAWNKSLIQWVNRELEERFWEQETIMQYLRDENLLDKWEDGNIWDRSYSILRRSGDGYISLAYKDALPDETDTIIIALRNLRLSLEWYEDDVFWQKENYLTYIDALITAFEETDTDRLIGKWSLVDTAWMQIRGPIQIVHPFEYYEDKYRKAVAAEWDVRLENRPLLESKASWLSHKMFHELAWELWIRPEDEIYRFSLQWLWRCQIYIGNPLFYFGSQLNWLPSAQVIPNDAGVSRTYGKKIYAFPEHILKRAQSKPEMQHKAMMVSERLRQKKKDIIFGNPDMYYKLYDIETIWHELWHTLWLEGDTEVQMNQTGNFKNIEEWKATTGWLVSFFLHGDRDMDETVIVDLVSRSITLIEWMKEPDTWPYYCEWLIHLKVLFDAGILYIDTDGRADINYNDATLERAKALYKEHYIKLIKTYREKRDANEFLSQYAVMEDGYLVPADEGIRAWVQQYYKTYSEHGNTVANT